MELYIAIFICLIFATTHLLTLRLVTKQKHVIGRVDEYSNHNSGNIVKLFDRIDGVAIVASSASSTAMNARQSCETLQKIVHDGIGNLVNRIKDLEHKVDELAFIDNIDRELEALVETPAEPEPVKTSAKLDNRPKRLGRMEKEILAHLLTLMKPGQDHYASDLLQACVVRGFAHNTVRKLASKIGLSTGQRNIWRLPDYETQEVA